MKRVIAIAACVALVTLAFLFWGSIQEPAPTPSPAASTDSRDTPDQPVVSNTSPTPPQTGDNSSGNVGIKGFTITVDARGNLVPAPEIRQLFDTLAREQGQVPADQWKSHILDGYEEELGEAAHEQLETLLNRYIEYNLALQLLPMDGVATLAGALDHVRRIRRDYLGDAAGALFRDWQQMETFTNQFVEQVVGNHQDIPQLKQSLQEQIYALPASVQPQAQRVLDQSQDLFDALGSSQAEPHVIQGIAEQMAARALIQPNFTFGDPSAEFMEQYNAYTGAKQELQQEQDISSEDDPQLEALRQQYFSGSELLRVKTLDRAEMY